MDQFKQLNVEIALVTVISVLCGILFLKLIYKLRTSLPWRANCWFCNHNFWIKFISRNCWTCPKCEQYNGFTKDGDYNKSLQITSNESTKSPKVFQKSPPKNGLCKMCNINQQFKIVQLANFVPMNESKFNEEVDFYKAHLEKAYKLCATCKKVLQIKLHKEKESLLGSKILENRTLDKKTKAVQYQRIKQIINNTSTWIAGVLIALVSIEFFNYLQKQDNVPSTISNLKNVAADLIDRILCIIKIKILLTFPFIENYLFYFNKLPLTEIRQVIANGELYHYCGLAQKYLGGFVCFIQIVGHLWNINKLKLAIIIDLLWTVFVVATLFHNTEMVNPLYTYCIKLTSALAVLLVYKILNNKKDKVSKVMNISNSMKNLANGSKSSIVDEEDTLSLDTDDDVSLCKFGLHNFSDSSHETVKHQNNSVISGRSFTPRIDSIWNKPKLNSTFCANSVVCKSPSSVSDNVFIKPSFHNYQKFGKDDSDSELDESISSLCIGSPKKSKNSNSIFSLRKFTATPSFVVPTPLNRSRPLISPSKLGHSTSWVAGGYWGSDGERTILSVDGSRSSSQSSGFESQTSSITQRNVFSQPPSREESVCGEPMIIDNIHSGNTTRFSGHDHHAPQTFSSVSSPVFPQMQYNSHVHIPQPRLAHQGMVPQNMFAQQQNYVQNHMFKIPGGSGLIKLPQVNSFSQ